jgi:nitrite reductase/ring-hydroxylating ferredoxin subunit
MSEATVVDVALAPGEMHALKLDERKVLVCRVGDDYFAIENVCPHAAVPLSRGKLVGHELECPFHGGRLDVRDGRPVHPPIRRSARTYTARAVDGGIEIQLRLRD